MNSDVDSDKFQEKVKECEMNGVNLTSRDQIYRLTKPTSKYLNLNPYEVLQLPFGCNEELVKKHFRKLSILVHPDKNSSDVDNAKAAFEVVKMANEILKRPEEIGKIRLIYDEALAMFKKKLENKRKRILNIEEDEDPIKYFELKRATVAKLFADYELKRQEYMETDNIDRRRYKDEEIFNQFTTELEAEYQKAWEANRTQRVDSWRSFTSNNKAGKKKKIKALRPPPCRPEVRTNKINARK